MRAYLIYLYKIVFTNLLLIFINLINLFINPY